MAHIVEHGISYGTRDEYHFRYAQFRQTLNEVNMINSDPNMTHQVGINYLATWTKEEKARLLGYRGESTKPKNYTTLDETKIADSVNWVTKGAVTPVKNQGQCGSCWSFSTTGALEGAHQITSGNLVSLSEQQFVDCDKVDQGCNGGLMDNAFTFAETHKIVPEASYPYTARRGVCKPNIADLGVVQVSSYTDVPPKSASQMKAALNKAPVAIAIEADQMSFQGYTGGVITSGCGQRLDHGVLAVGYGEENGTEYVLVKNSWGASWGVDGYVKLGLNENACGFLNAASYPQTN